jgi:hypothetical protein
MEFGINEFMLGIGFLMAFIIGCCLGYISDTANRAKIMNRISKGNFGMIKLVGKGNRITRHIQNLDSPIYKAMGLMFNPDKTKPRTTYLEQGITTLYYNMIDTRPMKLEDGTETNMIKEPDLLDLDYAIPKKLVAVQTNSQGVREYVAEISNDPTGLMGAFMAYDQAKEAEFKRRMQKSNLETLAIYGSLLGILIVGYLIYSQGEKFDEIIKALGAIQASVSALKPVIV